MALHLHKPPQRLSLLLVPPEVAEGFWVGRSRRKRGQPGDRVKGYNMPKTVLSSGLLTADAVIHAKPCLLRGLTLITDGSNNATAVLHDHAASASGTVVGQATVPAADITGHISYPLPGVVCSNGIFADITAAGAGTLAYIVYFTPGAAS